MQGERSSKTGKLCFTVLDTAEPQLALCKGNANERKESLLFISRTAACLIQRQCKVSATARRENFVLPDLILSNRSLPYTKIRKMVCNVNTITLFFRNQEYIKKHKTIVLNVKLLLLQTENYAVEIRKTESESKNGSILHIAQHSVIQRIIQNNLPTTLFPVHDKGFSAKPKRLFRHAGKTLRHPQTHFPAAPKSPFERNKSCRTQSHGAEHAL